MTANAQTKAEPKWKAVLRRALWGRPKPFWRKRLEEQIEIDDEPGLWDVGDSIFLSLLVLTMGALIIAALGMLVIGPLFTSPDFFSVGVADPLGRWYAAVCAATGQCHLGYLLAGTVVGVLLLTLGTLTIHASWWGQRSAEPVGLGDVVAAVGVLDERLVRLRADLVLAGHLKLSPEELAEDSEE